MLLKHTLLYLPAQCIAPLVQLGSIILWAHLLSPSDVGIVTLVMAIQELSFAAFFTWWSHYALRFISGFKDAEPRARFIGTEGVAVILSMVLQTVVTLPLLLFFFPNDMTSAAATATTFFMVTRSINNYLSERSRSEAHIALYTVMQVGGPLFGLLIGLALIWAWAPGVVPIFLGFIIAQAGCATLGLLFTDVGRVFTFDRDIMRRAVRFGIPMMLAGMLAMVAINAPRFVVEHFAGLAAVGRFSVGYGLGLRASSFAVMLVTAGAYPLVVRKMEREGLDVAYEQLGKNIVLVALVVIPVALGLLAVNTSVIDLVVPKDYREVTYLVLPYATIGGMLRFLRAHTTDQVFMVRSRTGYNTLVGAIDLLFAVASSCIGLWLYGVPGAAFGPMVSGAITLVASLLLSRVMLGFHVPVKAILSIFAAASVMAVIVYMTPAGPGFLGLGLRVALGIVIYAAGVAALLPMGRDVLGKVIAMGRSANLGGLLRAR